MSYTSFRFGFDRVIVLRPLVLPVVRTFPIIVLYRTVYVSHARH